MHEYKIRIRYFGELVGSLSLFFLVQALSMKIERTVPAGSMRTLVLFSPMLPFLLMIGAVVRYFRKVDEYMRLKILENLAMTAAATGILTFTYGYLEAVGLPRLSMTVIMPTMGVISAILFIVGGMARR